MLKPTTDEIIQFAKDNEESFVAWQRECWEQHKMISGVIRYAKNLQIACRFPSAPFDA